MADGTIGSIQYVINTTLGELGALLTLKKQLQDIQAIAKEGAAFNVSINPEALNGLQRSVQQATNGGFRKGAFDKTTDAMRGSGGSDKGIVLSELRQVVSALQKLAGTAPGGRRPASAAGAGRSYADQSEEQRGAGYDRKNALLFAVGKGRSYQQELDKVGGETTALIDRQMRALQVARVRGKETLSKERTELLKQFDTAKAMGDTRTMSKVRDEMRAVLAKIEGAIQERIAKVQKEIDTATRHSEMATRNQELQGNSGRRSAAASGRATGQGLVLDATQITATMERAAEAFAARLAAYVPEVPNLDRERVPVGAAAALAAGANETRIGSAAHRAQYQPIIPSSSARQASNLKRYSQLSSELANGVNWEYATDSNGQRILGPDGYPTRVKGARTRELTTDERIGHQQQMDALSYELLLGGVPATYGNNHPDVHNGLMLAKWEKDKVTPGASGYDPRYIPTPAAGPVDPRAEVGDLSLKQMGTHANELAGALERLRELNLEPLVAQFQTLATAINEARRDMNGFYGAGQGTATEKEIKLAANKALNAERERHAQTMQDIRREATEEARRNQVKRRADELIRATAFETSVGAGSAVGDYDSGLMVKRLASRFRRLDRLVQRQGDLSDIGSAYSMLQLPTHENVGERLRNQAAFMGIRTGLLRDLQNAAVNEPRRYKGLLTTNLSSDPAASYTLPQLLQDSELHQRRVAAVGLLDAMQGEHKDLIAKSVKDPKYTAQANAMAGQIVRHLSMMQNDLGLGSGMEQITAAQAARDLAQHVFERARAQVAPRITAFENAKTARTRLNYTDDENPGLVDRTKADKDDIERRRAEADAEVARAEESLNRAQARQSKVKKALDTRTTVFQGLFTDGVPTNTDVNGLKSSLAQHNVGIEDATKKVLALGRARTEEAKLADEQGMHWDRLARKLKDIAAYVVAGGLVYSTIAAARTAIRETARFEQDMAEVQGIFVGKTATERDLVKQGVMSSAVQYGVDRSTVAGIAKTFAQTGANPTRTIEMTNAALMGARGAGLNADQATEMLIAVDNMTNGRVGSGDILDRISRVEARYPVTGQDLSTVLQRVGPMAQHLQPNMRGSADAIDMLMGMSTSLISKTRMTGSQAGTALRFMLARLSSPNVQKKLQDNFGVMLGGSNPNEMRNMSDILGDIAGKYKGYMANGESAKAAALLTTFAGARQANSAAALFDDWTSTMNVAKESSMAFGDSQRRLAIQMDTLEVKTQQATAALLNFATVMLDKTGILAALKFGADTTTSLAGLATRHPIYGVAGLTGTALGLGSLLQLLGKSESVANLGFGSQFLPMIGGALRGAGVIAAGVGTYHAVRNLNTWFRGGHEGAFWQPTKATGVSWIDRYRAPSEDEARMADLYGPQTFDRSTYDDSEQGKDYKALAGRFALSPNSFYATMTQAAADANQDAIKKFGPNALTTPNEKLGAYIQDQFIEHLNKTLPGFDQIKDKSEQAATALEGLRKSAQYGGVSYYVQQGKFTEDAQQLGQAIVQKLQEGGMSPEVAAGLRQDNPELHIVNRVGGQHPRSFTYYQNGFSGPLMHVTNAAPEDLGLAYSRTLAERGGRTAVATRNDDISRILNSLHPDFKLGNMLAGAFSTGHASFLSVVDSFVEKGQTLGQALDSLAMNMTETTKAELDNLRAEKAKGTLNKEQLEDLRKRENFSSFVGSVQSSLGLLFNTDARKAAAQAGGPEADSLPTGGGAFAEKLRQAMEIAVRGETTQLGPDSDRAKAMQAYFDAHFNSKNWESTKENIVGAFNGVNLRAYLRDRVLDQFFQFGAREGTIGQSETYLRGTGMIYDAGQERLRSAQQLLTGLLDVSGQLPMDRIKAAMRVNMAAGQQSVLQTGGDLYDESGLDGTTEEGRNVLAPKLRAAYEAYVKGGGGSDRQIEQLGVNLKSIQAANKEWRTGKPGDLFNYLDGADQKTMATIMGLSDMKELAAYGAVANDAVLRLAQHMVTARALDERETSLGEITRAGEANRGLLSTRFGYAARTQGVQRGLALQQLYGDQFGAFGSQHALIGAEQGATIGLAQQDYTATLKEIWYKAQNDTTGGIAPDGTLIDKYASQATDAAEKFKSAVVEANLTAQQNLVQLLDDTHLEYLKRLDQHSQDMVKGFTEPVTRLLANPRELLSSRKGGELVTEIGQFGNQKLAQAFMDNLVGPQGLFGQRIQALFGKSQMFQDAELIRQAHVNGIVQGFQAVGYSVAGGSSAGLATGLPTTATSGAGSLLPAGLVMLGAGAASLGTSTPTDWGMDHMTPLSGVAPVAVRGADDGSFAAALQTAQAGAKSAQKKAAIAQMATMASIYLAGNFFNNHGAKGANGKPNNYAIEGSQFGATVGGLAGSFLPGGPAVWGAVGGFLGGLFGGQKKKPEEPVTPEYAALQKIERNTRESVDAITNQTRTLLTPENRLLYAPSTFQLPGQQPFGGSTSGAVASGGVNVTIHIDGTGHDTRDLAAQVGEVLKAQLSQYGTFADPRF